MEGIEDVDEVFELDFNYEEDEEDYVEEVGTAYEDIQEALTIAESKNLTEQFFDGGGF